MSGRVRTVLMCVVVTLACPLASHAQDAAAGPKRPQPDMMAMDKAFRALNAQIKDAAQNAASLAAVAQMQAATVAAKDGMPPLVAALPAAEQAARIVEYKKELEKLLRQEIDLEEQLLNGDNAKAADTLAAMQATQQEGHRGFRPPPRGRGPGGGAPGGGAPGGGAPGNGGGGRRGAGAGAPTTP
jgi:hypothetical protein